MAFERPGLEGKRLTEDEAAEELQTMYAAATLFGEKSRAALLFGVRFAAEIEGFTTTTLGRIAKRATGSVNYGYEISKGRWLAGYAEIAKLPPLGG